MQLSKWLTKQAKTSHLIVSFTFLIVLSVLLLGWLTHDSDSSVSFRISLHIDKNGLPTLLGVNLGKGWFRDSVFRTLRIGGVRVKVFSGYLTSGSDTNLVQTFKAIDAAGLWPPPPPPKPSPYE